MSNYNKKLSKDQVELLKKLTICIYDIEKECQMDDDFNNFVSKLGVFDFHGQDLKDIRFNIFDNIYEEVL